MPSKILFNGRLKIMIRKDEYCEAEIDVVTSKWYVQNVHVAIAKEELESKSYTVAVDFVLNVLP